MDPHPGVPADVPFDRPHQQEDTGAEAGRPLADRDRGALCEGREEFPPGLSTSTWTSTARCSARRTVSRRRRPWRTRWRREPSRTPRSFTEKVQAVVSASRVRSASPHASFHHCEVLAALACAPDSDTCARRAEGCASNAPHSAAAESARRQILGSPLCPLVLARGANPCRVTKRRATALFTPSSRALRFPVVIAKIWNMAKFAQPPLM
jgi:hypothetical protein